MQTIYYQTTQFVRRQGNVIDFADYHRRQQLQKEAEQAQLPQQESWPSEDWQAHAQRIERERESRRHAPRPMLLLDLCATLGIVAMTLTFTIQTLVG